MPRRRRPRRGARRVLAALAAALLCPATACHLGALPAGDAPAMAEAPAEIAPAPQAHPPGFEAGEVFRDCPHCPEMVVVPAGSFMMGADSWGEPVHLVTIGSPFAVGVYEVTFDEWDACVSAGGCGNDYLLDDEGWGRGRRPAIHVTWNDAQDYVVWLSQETGESYRLLSESEWEYAARAGTTTRYWWGDDIGRNRANCDGCGSRWDNESTAPVGSFEANAFGLYDVHGNVEEWVQDCWNDSYVGAPGDGSAWESGDCFRSVLRGGSWNFDPRGLRAATRYRYYSMMHMTVLFYGFRVARTFTPDSALPAGETPRDAPVMADAPAETGPAPQAQPLSEPAAARAPGFEAGRVFRDCPHCPEMVVVPAGTFMMGSPASEEDRDEDEGPVHRITIGAPFAVGVYEVTFAEWDACASAGGCRDYGPERDNGWGRGQRPAINVTWHDAQAYVSWLSRETGAPYRLLSESEWEYAARAGTTTRYWWGDDIGRNRANCDSCGSRWDGESTAPVGSFEANAFGLHDVHGNVSEWTQDCWNDSYADAPGDGSAWESGQCSERVLRDGFYGAYPKRLRAALRYSFTTGIRLSSIGFRVTRTFAP